VRRAKSVKAKEGNEGSVDTPQSQVAFHLLRTPKAPTLVALPLKGFLKRVVEDSFERGDFVSEGDEAGQLLCLITSHSK